MKLKSTYCGMALAALVLAFGLQACSNEESQTSKAVETVQQEQQDANKTVNETGGENQQGKAKYQPDYIYAVDLNRSMQDGTAPFVFDVRSTHAFEKSHITDSFSMPFGKTEDAMLAAVGSLTPDSEIVTYCGCPKHLATLAAEDLNNRGYKNVRVLYEGYWYWKDQGFPVFETETDTATTLLEFDGTVRSSTARQGDVDLFITHPRTGQLEAVRTDSRGAFEVEFRLYDYRPGDPITVMTDSLENAPVKTLSLADNHNARVTLDL